MKWYRLWDWILHIGEFDDVLDAGFSEDLKSDVSEEIITEHNDLCVVSSSDCNGSIAQYECQKLLEVCNLTLQTPRSGNILIKDLSFVINEGDHLLVCDFLWFFFFFCFIHIDFECHFKLFCLIDYWTKWKWQNFILKSSGWSVD